MYRHVFAIEGHWGDRRRQRKSRVGVSEGGRNVGAMETGPVPVGFGKGPLGECPTHPGRVGPRRRPSMKERVQPGPRVGGGDRPSRGRGKGPGSEMRDPPTSPGRSPMSGPVVVRPVLTPLHHHSVGGRKLRALSLSCLSRVLPSRCVRTQSDSGVDTSSPMRRESLPKNLILCLTLGLAREERQGVPTW